MNVGQSMLVPLMHSLVLGPGISRIEFHTNTNLSGNK